MYKIVGSKFKDEYETFMKAFEYQQKHYPNNYIIYYSENGVIEIVWNPDWEELNCSKLEKEL